MNKGRIVLIIFYTVILISLATMIFLVKNDDEKISNKMSKEVMTIELQRDFIFIPVYDNVSNYSVNRSSCKVMYDQDRYANGFLCRWEK